MSRTMISYLQVCDLCQKTIQLTSKANKLTELILPDWNPPADIIGEHLTTVKVSVCKNCLRKLVKEISLYMSREYSESVSNNPQSVDERD